MYEVILVTLSQATTLHAVKLLLLVIAKVHKEQILRELICWCKMFSLCFLWHNKGGVGPY